MLAAEYQYRLAGRLRELGQVAIAVRLKANDVVRRSLSRDISQYGQLARRAPMLALSLGRLCGLGDGVSAVR